MKKLIWVLSLTLSLVSTGMASANEFFYAGASPLGVSVSASFPGLRPVYGRPGVYCWYQGRYYSRAGWNRFRRFDRDRYAYYRSQRDEDRNYGRDQERDNRWSNDSSFERNDRRDYDRNDRGNYEDRERF